MTETRMNDRIAELKAALANGDITPDLIFKQIRKIEDWDFNELTYADMPEIQKNTLKALRAAL